MPMKLLFLLKIISLYDQFLGILEVVSVLTDPKMTRRKQKCCNKV